MSIHANLSSEAETRLHNQQRNSTIASVTIAASVIVLIALLLGLVLLPTLEKEPAEIAILTPAVTDPPGPDTPKPPVDVQQTPAKPAAAMMPQVLTAMADSPTSIPTLDVNVPEISVDSGSENFGTGWGTGTDVGDGHETAFGSTSARRNALKGSLYDFKQSPQGKPVSYDQNDFPDYVTRLQRSRFSEASLNRFFSAPTSLYLTHLAIANSPASEGPEFFGAKDTVRPSGWVVPYRGTIRAPKSGSYRFSGFGDDYLVVMLKGRMCLSACWPDTQDRVRGRWDPSEPTGKFKSPYDGGVPLVFGDWVKLEAGEPVDIVIAIGERPGGKVGFVLNIEEKGVPYRKAPDGRPILPLFAIGPISSEEQARIKNDFGSFEFEWENMPVFTAQ